MSTIVIGVVSLAALLFTLADATRAEAVSHVAIAWDDTGAGTSWVGAVAADAPNSFVGPPLPVSGDGVLRAAGETLLHVSRSAGELTQIELSAAGTMSSETIVIGSDFELRDVAVVDASTAWLSARGRDFLVAVDLTTGTVTNGIDLRPLGVAVGVLTPERMLVHQGRLYLQLRRLLGSNQTSYVAVIDIATETIVDADPVAAGVQGIALAGTEPRYEMQVVPGTQRLMLSATGALLDAGGIETIDLDTLTTEGVLLSDTGGFPTNDFGPFLMLDATMGWFSGATSIVESSHLFSVDISNPQPTIAVGNEIFFTSPSIVHDPQTNRIFWPIPDGLRFFDATTGVEDVLSPASIPVGTTTDIEPLTIPEAVPVPGVGAWPLLIGLLLVSIPKARIGSRGRGKIRSGSTGSMASPCRSIAHWRVAVGDGVAPARSSRTESRRPRG